MKTFIFVWSDTAAPECVSASHTGEGAKAAGTCFGQIFFLWTHHFQLASSKKASILYVVEVLVRGKKEFEKQHQNSSVLTMSSFSVCL